MTARRARSSRSALPARWAAVLALVAPLSSQEPAFDFGAVAAEAGRRAAAGELDRAIACLEAALPRLADQPLQRAWAHKYTGEMRRAQGRYEDALAELDTAEAILDEVPEGSLQARRIVADLWTQRGRVDMDYGLLDRAADELRVAREHLDALAATGLEIRAEVLGLDYAEVTLLAAREDWERLLETRDRLLYGERGELYRANPFHESQLQAKFGAALFEMARLSPERVDECRATLEAALAFPELPLPDRTEPLLALAQLDAWDGDWQAAEERLARAGATLGPPDERAEVPLLYGKWLGLRAALAMTRRDRQTPRGEMEEHRALLGRAIDREIERWSLRPLRPGGYGLFSYNPIQILTSEWIRLVLALDGDRRGPERALGKLIEAQAAGTLVRRSGGTATDVEDFRERWIGDDREHVVLVWLPAADRSHLFVLDHDGLEHVELPAVDLLERDRRALERTIAAPLGEGVGPWRRDERRRALVRLRDALLPPAVLGRLAGSARLTIVGLDLLGEVPYEALPLGEASLGTRLAITYLPSLPLGMVLAGRGAAAPPVIASDARALLVGAVEPEAPLFDLAAFEAMVAPYGERASILRGERASFRAMCSAAPGAQVLQIYAHGGRLPGRERPAAFLLASPDGPRPYGADDVEAGLASPEAVLLTVCGSARGPRRRGDAGAGALAGAFLLAGERTRCVVTTAFDLDAHAAQRIATTFHAALLEGSSPAEALRRARAELAADEDFADPSYHGLIRAVGLGHVPLFAP